MESAAPAPAPTTKKRRRSMSVGTCGDTCVDASAIVDAKTKTKTRARARAKTKARTWKGGCKTSKQCRDRDRPRSRPRSRPRGKRIPHAEQPLLRPETEWFVYALLHPSACAPYVGSTNDLDRRLRQHNAAIAGGARRTTAVVTKTSQPWRRTLFVKNFPDHRSCLSFEKAVQRALRNGAAESRRMKKTPQARCEHAIDAVLARSAPSSLALPFATYAVPLMVVHELDV